MSDRAYSVALLVDPDYGDRLGALAVAMPVWIADTPTNRGAAEALRRRASSSIPHTGSGAITTFQVQPSESPSAWALSILGDIDLHHGEYSHSPPYDALEVIGTEASDDLREALREYGLTDVESRNGGFRASAPLLA